MAHLSNKDNSIIKKAVLSAVISFILFTALYSVIHRSDRALDRERYAYIARSQAEHIITTIDCVMSRTNTLKIMVKEHSGDTSWFDDVAEDIYTSVQNETGIALKNFAIAPGGVVSDVYPMEGNEALVGFDFLDLSRAGNLEAKEAYENDKTIITNPFELVQGGIGMGGRAAVVIKNGDTHSLWGLVTVTIDFDNLMEVSGLDNLQGMGVEHTLSYIDQDGSAHFMHGAAELGDDAVVTRFNVRNLTWELKVRPDKGRTRGWEGVLSMAFILMLSSLAGVLTYMMIRLRESNAMLLRLSITDGLTGCYNRRAYEDKILELSSKKIDDDLIYVSVDVNGLKQTNDTLGHAAGDELLSGVASCLDKGFGRYGSIYRIGGDEFVALICADEKTFTGILKDLREIMDAWKGSRVDKLSVSVGYAAHRDLPDMTVGELCRYADRKMYEAKREYYQKDQ